MGGSHREGRTLHHNEAAYTTPRLSPDGNRVAVRIGPDLWIQELSTNTSSRFTTEGVNISPVWSPDGKWLVFDSNQSGRSEVYVQPFPGSGRRWPISNQGGQNPMWSPHGDELFYLEAASSESRTQRLVAVDVTTEPEFRVGPTRVLFERSFPDERFIRPYDVTPDGERFVMTTAGSERPSRHQVNIVLNWFTELERLAPRP